jgi:hypothetical protein
MCSQGPWSKVMSSTMTDFMTWSSDFSLQASRLDLQQHSAQWVLGVLHLSCVLGVMPDMHNKQA